jgi:hypothetical protein
MINPLSLHGAVLHFYEPQKLNLVPHFCLFKNEHKPHPLPRPGVNAYQRSSRNPLKNGWRTLPSADFALDRLVQSCPLPGEYPSAFVHDVQLDTVAVELISWIQREPLGVLSIEVARAGSMKPGEGRLGTDRRGLLAL